MTLTVGSVVALPAHGGAPAPGRPRKASGAAIIWKVDGGTVLWVPVVTSKGDGEHRHRADIEITDMAVHVACGFPMARPVIECRKLLRRDAALFDGRTVFGHIPAPLMTLIAETQIREARQLAAEIRLGHITQRDDMREAA